MILRVALFSGYGLGDDPNYFIAFNMIALYFFGPRVEARLGQAAWVVDGIRLRVTRLVVQAMDEYLIGQVTNGVDDGVELGVADGVAEALGVPEGVALGVDEAVDPPPPTIYQIVIAQS